MAEREHDEALGPGTGAHAAVEDLLGAADVAVGELEEDVEFPEGEVGAGGGVAVGNAALVSVVVGCR